MEKNTKKKKSWFKRNWHILAIALLLALFMSQCTKSCSRGQTIKMQDTEIAKRDSIINELEQRIDTLKNSVNYYTALFESEKSHNSNFASIATGNQAELYGKITQLEQSNAALDNTIKRLTKENKALRDSLDILRKD